MQPTALLVGSLIGAAAVVAWRLRETSRPINARSILIPPLGMSTGFSMFAYAPFRIPASWGLVAFAVGAGVFAYPMIKTSRLVRVGDLIFVRRSRAFLAILLGLVALRFALREYVGAYLSPLQTASIFFVLAFGMIVRWRALMYLEYRRLLRTSKPLEPLADPMSP
jgi:membrane protein CcdC involved in cytochrome C biogenesis